MAGIETSGPIRIGFVDFPGPANPDAIVALLKRHFEIVIDNDKPDYLFYSVFGRRFLEFPDAIRIFFTGENVHADFNLCDYAFGFDWMVLEDRYCRCPNYQLYQEFESLRASPRIPDIAKVFAQKTRFCDFIYSNANAHPYREELFHRLTGYRSVDAAGLRLNNTGFTVGRPSLGVTATMNKIDFQRQCKFSIAIENSSGVGYTTEKLVHALVAGTIPIYWGNPEVGREFNTRRFVNCHELGSFDAVVERVKELDQDDEAYLKMLGEDVFPDGRMPSELAEDALVKQFRHIFSQGQKARRRNRYVWGEIYEAERLSESSPPTLGRWLRHRGTGLKAIRVLKRFTSKTGGCPSTKA